MRVEGLGHRRHLVGLGVAHANVFLNLGARGHLGRVLFLEFEAGGVHLVEQFQPVCSVSSSICAESYFVKMSTPVSISGVMVCFSVATLR